MYGGIRMIKTTIVGYGESYLKATETYIYRLDHYLSLYYPTISWKIHQESTKFMTTRCMLQAVKEKVLVHNPNIVFIELSSNDICNQTDTFISLEEYEINLTEIITTIKSYPNRTGLNGCIPIPILITPPPVNESLTGKVRTNNRLAQYAYVAKTVATSMHCPSIDLFHMVLDKADYETVYLKEDGIHLSQKGQDLLYDLVFLELTKLINYQGVLKDRDVTQDTHCNTK